MNTRTGTKTRPAPSQPARPATPKAAKPSKNTKRLSKQNVLVASMVVTAACNVVIVVLLLIMLIAGRSSARDQGQQFMHGVAESMFGDPRDEQAHAVIDQKTAEMEHANDLKAVELLAFSQQQGDSREKIKWDMHWSEEELAKYEKMLVAANKAVDQLDAALQAGMTRDRIAKKFGWSDADLTSYKQMLDDRQAAK